MNMHLIWLYVVAVIVVVVVGQNREEDDLIRHTRGKEYKDCEEVRAEMKPNGVYLVSPNGTTFPLLCQDGWMVVLLNKNGNETFNVDWKSYWNGFGAIDNNFWTGLKNLHEMSYSKRLHLRVDLVAADGKTKAYAEYDTFRVGPEADKGRLTIGGYSANSTAGESLTLMQKLEGLLTVNNTIWYTFKKLETLSKVTMGVKLDIDECASGPCQNGGSCTDGVNTYTCQCAAGFKGAKCDDSVLGECASGPCQNGGSCTAGVNTYTCQCAAGFDGDNCDAECKDLLAECPSYLAQGYCSYAYTSNSQCRKTCKTC